jgi:putative sporulation protein YtaF
MQHIPGICSFNKFRRLSYNELYATHYKELMQMIFSIAILAISLSLDALGVGIVYGLRKIKIPLSSKLIICFFSILYSGLSVILGKTLSKVLSGNASKLIGIAILILMGIWIIIQAIVKKNEDSTYIEKTITQEKTLLKVGIKSLGITIQIIKNPIKGDLDKSGVIDTSESLLLGLALSLDAIGVGIGSALAGFHSMAIPFAVGLCQLIFIYIGTYAGEKFFSAENINKTLFSILPGVLLILLALLRMF